MVEVCLGIITYLQERHVAFATLQRANLQIASIVEREQVTICTLRGTTLQSCLSILVKNEKAESQKECEELSLCVNAFSMLLLYRSVNPSTFVVKAMPDAPSMPCHPLPCTPFVVVQTSIL
jgi:hypothetical protein